MRSRISCCTEVRLGTLGMNGSDGLHAPFFEHLQAKPPTALAHQFATLSTMSVATSGSLGAHQTCEALGSEADANGLP